MRKTFVSFVSLILTLALGIGMTPMLSITASSDTLANLFDLSA